jgi:hypothetical protein
MPFRNSISLTNLMFFVVFLSSSGHIFGSTSNFKTTIFWDIAPFSPLKVNRRFRGTYRLNFYSLIPLSRWYFGRLILRPWRWRRHVPPKRRLTFNGLHGAVSLKSVLFIITAVRITDPAYLKFGHDHFIARPSSFAATSSELLTESFCEHVWEHFSVKLIVKYFEVSKLKLFCCGRNFLFLWIFFCLFILYLLYFGVLVMGGYTPAGLYNTVS